MSKEDALNIIYNYILGEDSILVSLRMGDGLNEQHYSQLIEAMKLLTKEYKDKSEVPKKLALCFVDISNFFYFNEGIYSSEVQDRLENAVHEISQVANELFESNMDIQQ
ncbi:hypothetical protein [Cohnella mopanensis]|uniref:hypothetical protein n=1 Tax=Cohnella mopanensis TaxID=2911966 RepID=UPI001EF93368|nr:hypothetical protein [Cohnella mopanensis]